MTVTDIDVRLLTRREVAERLGVGETTVKKLLASGRLRSVVIGSRTRRVRMSDLAAYVDSLRGEAS